MHNLRQNLPLFVYSALGLIFLLFIANAEMTARKAKYDKNISQQEKPSDVQALYRNLGVATKAMFFHELKKNKR